MHFRSLIRAALLPVVVAVCVLATSVDAQPKGYDGYQVVSVTVGDKADIKTVNDLQRELGRQFQIWSEVVKPGQVEVRIGPAAQQPLDISGLSYSIVHHDLQRHIDSLYSGGKGFFDSIQSYDGHVQFMNDLVAAHPDLAEMVNLGESIQGRPMWAIRITGPGDVKPGLIYHGAEHGNEQAGASVVAYAANWLLTNYDTDPYAKYLVDNVEWYILPIMNPDGYAAYDRWNANGVDLNRNWDGPGSGEDWWGGPYPFSEPETQHMRDFFLAHENVQMHIDFHGYVNWIMWVWGHIPDHCPEHAQYQVLGDEYESLVYQAGGGHYDVGTIYDVAYYVSGCSCNWVYAEANRWSFAIEVINDDMPDICEEFIDGQLMLAEWIRGYDCNGNGVADSEDIANHTSDDDNDNGIPDECEELCVEDVNGDDEVNIDDIFGVLAAWGPCDDCPEDVTDDGLVDIDDVFAVLAAWGPC